VGEDLKKLSDCTWEIPVGYKRGMRVPGIIYADDSLMKEIRKDESLEQVANSAFLPGIVKAALAMPDMHFGYGLPIGGVVATDTADGVVTPGGVGFDINCGVRLARTAVDRGHLGERGKAGKLADALFAGVPAGVGSRGNLRLGREEERRVMLRGARWAVERGMGRGDDLEHTEEEGCLDGADPDLVSEKAFHRGREQQGTLGSGNHFVEVQYVDKVYSPGAAAAFGLEEGALTLMVHSGSRGLGHQVCTDYLAVMSRAVRKYGIDLPDRQLACAPVRSDEGREYLAAMRCAANYAWANRQCLMWSAKEVMERVLGLSPAGLGLELVYDVAHNIVKIEKHVVEGRTMELAVHRKGATRAFGPGRDEVPSRYRSVGQPVVIPGDMGTFSFVMAGRKYAMEETFGSACHGAGRRLSRRAAVRAARGRNISRDLERRGIQVRSAGRETLAEEMPEAYKDVSAVVDVVEKAGIARKVARLRPLVVVKG
jgi:tRNA-splicing ligase RtcB